MTVDISAGTRLGLARPDLLREHALIGGIWLDSPARIAVANPADGTIIGHVPNMGAGETTRAVDAAVIAQASWAKWGGRLCSKFP